MLLTEECSTVLQKGIPPKLKDPGSFVVSCTIGKMTLDKALCDLGASINLMPLSMMRKLAIEELKPTRMSLVMEDRSIKTPNGIVENLLVKVGDFIFPADFVILDTEEEGNNSIILGRPFLATARAIIDVEKGEMIFRVHNEQMVLNVFKSMQHPPELEDHLRVDMIESLVEEMLDINHHEQEEEGPYLVTKVFPYGSLELLDEATQSHFTANGHRAKPYLGGQWDKEKEVQYLN
ncbi:uncharacterized protein LOC110265033 [Arachis ipaensis]|uniref:uncharacterized protein LOC110265033 n=1 Tax=Arachis ipaensis TaxID=130454 RepID=UPI000A2B074D|nr:uncharacterized protein LOC110265033 [Arachis ipaensis]